MNSHSLASNKYNKKACKKYCLTLNKRTDADIIAAIESQANKQGYIKRLIEEDIRRKKDT